MEEGPNKGAFPLLAASEGGFLEVMQALLDAMADVNQVGGQFSQSSLFQAAGYNRPHVIALLVRAGGDVNIANSQGATPLVMAAQEGCKEAVIALLVAKAAVNQVMNDGTGPVHMAAKKGHHDILKLLIKAGGDVNQLALGEISPLMTATDKGQVDCVKILLVAGANALYKTDAGYTALDLAIHCKHTAVIAILQAHIAQLDAKAKAEAEGDGEGEGK
jgi:ankyrin repeat protein